MSKRLSQGQQRAATLLRNAREDAGLSLSGLARELGLHPSMPSRLNAWESGRRPVSVVNLEKILNACGRDLVIREQGGKVSKRKLQTERRKYYDEELEGKWEDFRAGQRLCAYSWAQANEPVQLPFSVARVSSYRLEVSP